MSVYVVHWASYNLSHIVKLHLGEGKEAVFMGGQWESFLAGEKTGKDG